MSAAGGPSMNAGIRLLRKYQPRLVDQPFVNSLAGLTEKKCSRGTNTAVRITSQIIRRAACKSQARTCWWAASREYILTFYHGGERSTTTDTPRLLRARRARRRPNAGA